MECYLALTLLHSFVWWRCRISPHSIQKTESVVQIKSSLTGTIFFVNIIKKRVDKVYYAMYSIMCKGVLTWMYN